MEKRLSDLRLGEQAIISSFSALAETHVRKLLSFGVMPGAIVQVLQLSPTLVIQFEHTQLALDREIAARILVLK